MFLKDKKILFLFILLGLLLFEVDFAFALEVENYPSVLGVTMPVNPGLPDYVRYFFNFGMVAAVSLAIFVIIVGGIYWIISMGRGKITHEGKEWIMAGIKGLVLLLCSYLIAVTINPALVHPKLEGLTRVLPWAGQPTQPTTPSIPTITYQEIPIGTLTENLLARTMDCYDFDENGDPIDGDPRTNDLEPTFLNHDRIDCFLKLAESTEKKAGSFKKLSEQLVTLMEECSCKDQSASGSIGYSSENGLLKNIFLGNSEYNFESKINRVLLASIGDSDFTTEPYTQPKGELYNATNITAVSATLKGKIIDDGGGSCWFRFKWKKSADFKWQEGQWHGSFTTGKNFSETITGLEPNTTYEFTVEIKNAEFNSGNLPNKTFKTLPLTKPSAELLNASNITATSATLNGKITDDGGDACQYQFKWRKVGDSEWTFGGLKGGSHRTDQDFSQNITGLEPSTTYEFTAEVKNTAGTILLTIKWLTTKSVTKPSAELLDASNITATSAILNGKITDDGGDACQYQFKWRKVGDSEWIHGGWKGSLRTRASFTQSVSGLEPSTTYEFTAEVKNRTGSSGELPIKTFVTKAAGEPAGELYDALNITATSATLKGKIIDDGNADCYYQFKWRKFGDSGWTFGGLKGGSHRTNQDFSQNITGLMPNTNYEFTAEITNKAGKTSGNLSSKSFNTLSVTQPVAELSDASNITATSAILNGKITDDGGDACQYQFKWRKVGDFGWIHGGWKGSLRTRASFTQSVSGLEPSTTYEFTAEVKNRTGSSGELPIKTFTTTSATGLSCEVYGAGSITTTSANLNGKVISDGGDACQYQFKWRKVGDSEWIHGGWKGSLRTGASFTQSVSGLAANTTYEYVAEIKNNIETIACVFKKLGPPLGLNAVALNTTQVFVSWVKGYKAENTVVRRDKERCPQNPTDGVFVYSGSAESFVDTGLTPNTLYCYVAWSVIGTIYSDPSNPAYVTTEKDSFCLTTKCPNCSRGETRKTPCPGDSPCPKECPACGCPSASPDCNPCPKGIKEKIEHGPIIIGEECNNDNNKVNVKEYKGLDEFRIEHPDIITFVEKEIEIRGQRIKIIDIEKWENLRLIDQLRYLKEKFARTKDQIGIDLNNLKNAESALSQCYYSKPYVELLKLIEQTNQEKLIIKKDETFKDPTTNDYVDISRYCLGFNYANSDCYHACQNICPGINRNSLDALRTCTVDFQRLASDTLTQKEIICLKKAFHNCPPNSAFGIFDNCLTDCKNQCSKICEQKYESCSEELEKCKEKCNTDSTCLLNNEEKCYVSFPVLKRCADTFGNFDDFKKCAETSFQCKYCSDQHAGYPDCSKTIGKDYSFSFFFKNPEKLKCPECYSKTATDVNNCVKSFPETYKCPSCSLCPECPCENIIEPGISSAYGICSGQCGKFAYNDDPLTFYCRTDYWEEIEEKTKTPVGKEKICPEQKEIPVGQTVDEAEDWAEKLIKAINDFVKKTEDMVEYIKNIGEEKNYCKCDSICQPGEPTCSIECEYKTTEVEYEDPDTGETVRYYICYCVQHSCDGNPCQKMINMLQGKAADDKCPKGTEYKGVKWYYEEIKETFEELKKINKEGRSEILKKLIYSREKMDECSVTAKLFKEKEVKLLNCKRVEDQIMPPIIYGKVIIGEKSLEKHCYGKRAGEVLKITEPLLDNWFCCERRLK